LLYYFVSFNFTSRRKYERKKREQIKVLKAAFFTEIGFTTSEAEKFWPVYTLMMITI
jgi:hypothetical protein